MFGMSFAATRARNAVAVLGVAGLLAACSTLGGGGGGGSGTVGNLAGAPGIPYVDPATVKGEVLGTGLPWQPTVDGVIVPELPLDAVRNGASRDVDLLAGSNTQEWRLFMVPGDVIDHIPPEAVVGTLGAFGLNPSVALPEYQDLHPNASTGDLFAAVMTDWYWRLPALRLAQAHAAQGGIGATYVYEFDWRSPQFKGRLGACHAIEIPFVFDTLGPSSQPLLGDAPPGELAARMHGAWVAFARNGDPGWDQFDPETGIAMRFDLASGPIEHVLAQEQEIWADVR